MSYLYYPGCSLKGTGKAYEESLLAVFETLNVSLTELPDWNCCGATSYMAVDEHAAFTLAARNIAIADQEGLDIVAPCSACYAVLNKAKEYIATYPEVQEKVNNALQKANLTYNGRAKIRHPLDIIVNDVGLDKIKEKVTNPLKGLRAFTYYGCLVIRPYNFFDHPCYPSTLDRLMETIGAEPVDHHLRTKCCGGSLTGTIEEVGVRLVYIITREAKKKGAHVIVTLCPLCQFNLEAYQKKAEKTYNERLNIPVVYFTQLLGIALGIPEDRLGLNRLLIPYRTPASAGVP